MHDGRDLLAVLAAERSKEEGTRKNSATAATMNAVRVLLLISSFLLIPGSFGAPPDAAPPAPRVAPAEMDRSLKEVFERREFAWRMPRSLLGPRAEAPKGPIARFFESILDFFSRVWKKITGWFRDFNDWLRKITQTKPNAMPACAACVR